MKRDYQNALHRIAIGAAAPNPNLVPAKVVREQAKVAATTAVNTKKAFFGYGRLVPQADILPEDQILTKNSDSQPDMEKWLEKLAGDPQMIWAGYFDNKTGKLVGDSIGESIIVTPVAEPPPPTKKKSNAGLIAGGVALGVGMIFAARKR
jgi:hypothetical protein